MASLDGKQIKDTYQGLIKTEDNGVLGEAAKQLTDGAGNPTGITLNNQGDIAASGSVTFGSLKDADSNATITRLVNEADGIGNNDNDTSIPTSAAVKDYVDSNITSQDLDISDGTNNGAVDLDSQVLTFAGDSGVAVTVSAQTVTFNSSTLQDAIFNEETARITADNSIVSSISSEEASRIAADNDIIADLAAEQTARAAAVNSLQSQISSNDLEISSLDSRLTTAESGVAANESDITGLDGRLLTAETKLATVEAGAEVNPDAAEIKFLYESNADTNAFTNALQSKLAGIEAGAEVNPTATEIKTAYESNANTNAFTDIEKSKLAGIESGAQVNTVTSVNSAIGAVVLDADDISDSATVNKFTTASDISKLAGIEAGAQVNTVDSVNGATGIVVLDTDDVAEGAINEYYTSAKVNSDIDARVTKSYVEALDLNINADKVVFDPGTLWDAGVTNTQVALDELQLNKANLADLPSNVTIFPTTAASDVSGYFFLATSTTDADYDTIAVNAPTGIISGTDQLISSSATDQNVLKGDTGLINVTFISEIRKVNGNPNNAFFYFELYKRDSLGVETLLATSTPTAEVSSNTYEEFFSTALIENATFTETDRIVLKFYGTSVGTGTDASFEARLGGTSPTRGLLPVPFGAVPVDSSASVTIADTASFNNILSSSDDTVQKALNTIDDMTLSSISDVSATAPSNGEVLTYNSISGLWEPASAGSAPVDSVNGQTGVVVLDADDIDDAATLNKFVTAADVTKLGNISITQPVDLDVVESDLASSKAKTDFITVTESVNLDTIKADTATNNAKISFDSASSTKLAGIEAGAQVNTVDSVNGLGGAVVLDADDIDDTLTINKFTTQGDIDKLAAITDTGSGNIISAAERTKLNGIEEGADVTDAANVTTALGSISVTAHSDVTSAGSGAIITAAERTKLNGIEAGADVTDTDNVVAALTAGTNITIAANGTISATDTNTTYSAGSGLSLVGTTFSHSDTSSAANLAASGRRYVTGLTFDEFGHVTGYTTGTETVVDTNTTYSAGAGLTLSGTTFAIQPDLRGEAYIIGRDANDYINVETTQITFALDGAVDMRLYNNGDLHVEGNVIGYSTSISDQKFKDDVTPIESALDKVKALKGVEYTWNATSKKGKRDLGFIAQEVEQIIPEIVTEHTLSTGEFADNPTQSKTIDYEKITAVLVEAVKEQQKQIDELKAKLDGITN